MAKKILFICGSRNQTTQMHQVSKELPEFEHYFTPYYCDGLMNTMSKLGMAEFAVIGKAHVHRCAQYLKENHLHMDWRGERHTYDLIVACSDLVVPKNVRGNRMVLVQEGMTDPENIFYHLVQLFGLPRWLASTSTTGLSDSYDRFCVASDGYKDLFIKKGVRPEKISVTGIPNFDNCKKFRNNNFPHHNYVLVCTSDSRETFKYENRKKIIRNAVRIANGRQLIFKLHPNEKVKRAIREIRIHAPDAMVFTSGSAEELIANCDVLICTYSSTVFVGLALGKEVHSYFGIDELKRLLPVQNGCSAQNIAKVCRQVASLTCADEQPEERSYRNLINKESFHKLKRIFTRYNV